MEHYVKILVKIAKSGQNCEIGRNCEINVVSRFYTLRGL